MNPLNLSRIGLMAAFLAVPSFAPAAPAEDALGEPSRLRLICSKITTAPKVAAGVICGVTVGVPVNIARSITVESRRMQKQMCADMSDEKPSLGIRTLSSSVAIPYGIISGIVKGSVQGVERGFQCGRQKPFSKESMSLGDEN